MVGVMLLGEAPDGARVRIEARFDGDNDQVSAPL